MDLETFARDPRLVAVRLDAAEVFGLLVRQAALPPDCAALVTTDDRSKRFEPAGAEVDGRNVRDMVVVRDRPAQVTIDVLSAASADGFDCDARLSLSVAVVPRQSDIEDFCRVILGASRRADEQRLTLYLRDAVERSAFEFIRTQPAEALIESRADAAFAAALIAALQPIAFSAGLSIGRHIAIAVVSPAFEAARRTRRDAEQRRRQIAVEEELRSAAAASQRLHVEELSTLLQRLDALARERPGVSVADLIRTFDPRERGSLYRQLLSRGVSSRRTAAIAVVAGHELLLFSPNDGSLLWRREFAGALGPLRSVRSAADGRTLLIGAATGVYVCAAADDRAAAYPLTPPRKLRGGVNSAVLLGEEIYATHSEVGVLRWMVGTETAAEVVLQEQTAGATSIRDIQVDSEGTLWFASGDRVVGWSPGAPREALATRVRFDQPGSAAAASGGMPLVSYGPAGSPAASVAIPAAAAATSAGGLSPSSAGGSLVSVGSIAGSGGAPRVESVCIANGQVYCGTSDGRVLTWACRAPQTPRVLLSGEAGRIESVQWLSAAGIDRLLVAAQRPAAWMLTLDDVSRIEYRGEEPLRWAAAADDWVMAVTDRRDRLCLWRPWAPEQIERTIFVGRQVGHSIQDAAVLAQAD